jgi:hypothetical protein
MRRRQTPPSRCDFAALILALLRGIRQTHEMELIEVAVAMGHGRLTVALRGTNADDRSCSPCRSVQASSDVGAPNKGQRECGEAGLENPQLPPQLRAASEGRATTDPDGIGKDALGFDPRARRPASATRPKPSVGRLEGCMLCKRNLRVRPGIFFFICLHHQLALRR